ncbi:MAG TPA: FAD-dependent oxidoreductase [Acidimicrobiia bacterium]|nr:FAD-dependent oxidoreductase [Acidimicrobiia bacterium]
MTERLVVIGGDAAGMSAASQARRRADDLEIIAFEKGDYTSYAACGLPYYVADFIDDENELVARTPEEHRANGIDVRLRHEVVAIHPEHRTVTVRDLDAALNDTYTYDKLVIATGSKPIRPDLPGVEAIGVHGIQTIADGIALRRHVDEIDAGDRRAVVVGGGYIGLEMAEALNERGMPVTVVDQKPQPMLGALDADIAGMVADAMRGIGIDLRAETKVEGFGVDDDGRVRNVETDDGVIEADIVVLGIGSQPNVDLARAAGITIGPSGGIAVDAHMRTSDERIWACGDCVESVHRITGKPMVIALGTHANKQGRIVGINVTGGTERFRGVLGTAVTRICEYEIGRTGLTAYAASEAGMAYVTATIESTTRAGYFPGAESITVKVVAEKATGRLLGAQIIGKEGAAKRIDVLATALWAGLSVEEVENLDLGYAPPFSPVWDPVLIAARKAAAQI